MMIAIKAKNKEELQKVIKQYRLELSPQTIQWWLNYWKSTNYYICISVVDGEQQGGGHACTKAELGTIPVLSFNEGVLIL
jgi:hypothetical protein